MVVAATALLGSSILGLTLLFSVKNWEERRGAAVAPDFRRRADEKASRLKLFLSWCGDEIRKIGPTSIKISRLMLHDLALTLAALSRSSERAAHRLADMVSHKHRFERKETKNEFLKQVSEAPVKGFRDAAPAPQASFEEEAAPAPRKKSKADKGREMPETDSLLESES